VLAALLFSMSRSRLLYGMTVTVGIAVCIAVIATRALLLVNRIHTAKRYFKHKNLSPHTLEPTTQAAKIKARR
jgi:hypothetical protein